MARVLVTSNAHAWRGVASPVEIRLWPPAIGADYLIARTGRAAERVTAELLSDALGGLPLAHEQAAAYCERLEISLTDYRKRFETTPARMLDSERDTPAEYHDRLTVAKTFALAIEEAAELHPAAEPLIVHAALLAPGPIPLFLFAEAREKFGKRLASVLADEAVAALRAFALLDRETIADERDPSIATDTIRLHRLVRKVAQERRDGKARRDMLRALVDAVMAVYPQSAYREPKVWPRCAVLLPQSSRFERFSLSNDVLHKSITHFWIGPAPICTVAAHMRTPSRSCARPWRFTKNPLGANIRILVSASTTSQIYSGTPVVIRRPSDSTASRLRSAKKPMDTKIRRLQ